jgi:hypothetical protein
MISLGFFLFLVAVVLVDVVVGALFLVLKVVVFGVVVFFVVLAVVDVVFCVFVGYFFWKTFMLV